MTFLGKVLIGVQVVLSLCFMAFAGAVFAVHQNWRTRYEAAQTTIQESENEKQTMRTEWQRERDQLQLQLNAANETANAQSLLASMASSDLLTARRDNTNLEQENQRLEGEVERLGRESRLRREEADEQRRQNRALQAALDAKTVDLRVAEDEKFALQVELSELQRIYTELLDANAHHLALLRQAGINPNDRVIGGVLPPPPKLDGRILQVHLDEAGRPKMVLLSLGEDDGLLPEHVLDVYRPLNGETLYIGKVRITSLLPNQAVAEVLNLNRNGIIEVADYVTTKL